MPIAPNRRRRRKRDRDLREPDNRAASYSRFSSDNQRDESIADQQRECLKAAEANDHQLPPEWEFADEAISGTKRDRTGLNAMLTSAEAGEFTTLYLYSLSRLARESIITMPTLKKLVHTYGIRVITVIEGIDSARDGWELVAAIYSVMHERFIADLAVSVRRGQEGALLAGYSVGDWCFGFKSQPVPGTEVNRRGRNAKPRMQYVIDDATATWVQRIFRWFVVEGRSIASIVRELNERNAPKDHRATTSDWHHQLVVSLLQREKYVGIWPWGEKKNVRDPETGDIRQDDRLDEECEEWMRRFDHLRIIDDEMFARAQDRLDANAEKWSRHRDAQGRLSGSPKGGSGRSAKRLLSGLMRCANCGGLYYCRGAQMRCQRSLRGLCKATTSLPMELAERMILDEIGRRIADDEEWFQCLLNELRKSYRDLQSTVPSEIASTEKALADLNQQIERLIDAVENEDAIPDVHTRLGKRRGQRAELERKLKRLKSKQRTAIAEPTNEWLREILDKLGTVIRESTPAANAALKAMIPDGIQLEQIPMPLRKRRFLRGHIKLSVGGTCQALECRGEASADAVEDVKIAIDFITRTPVKQQRELAMQLYEQGVLNCEIAQRLGVGKVRVTKLLQEAFELNGRQMPDGRSRRSKLTRKHTEPPLYQAVADQVMERLNEGLLLGQIAEGLDIDRNTVTKAIKFYHESRGLPVPDGRTRRKSLSRKSA